MMPKTIRELADELGVSKQRIQQIIAKLSPNKMPSKDGNKYILNDKDIRNIKDLMGFKNDNSSTNKSTNRVVDYDIYLNVIDSIKVKDEQIKSLLEVQKQTQNLLDQQQRLALQDKKLLEEYKEEIKDLKLLSIPEKDIEKKDPIQQENTVENNKEVTQKQKKKWWHFGRRLQ